MSRLNPGETRTESENDAGSSKVPASADSQAEVQVSRQESAEGQQLNNGHVPTKAAGRAAALAARTEPWRRRVVPASLQRDKLAGQVIRFGMVGAINTAVDWGLFLLFNVTFNAFSSTPLVTHPVLYLLANGVAYSAGILNSFLWNKHWTFNAGSSQRVRREALIFLAVSLASLAINTGGLYALRWLFTGTSLLTVGVHKLGTTIVTMTWNFLGYRFLAFRHAQPQAERESGAAR